MKKKMLCPIIAIKIPVTFTVFHTLRPDINQMPNIRKKKDLKKFFLENLKETVKYSMDDIQEDKEYFLGCMMGTPKIDEVFDWISEEVDLNE